jgi:hypothetical protein
MKTRTDQCMSITIKMKFVKMEGTTWLPEGKGA